MISSLVKPTHIVFITGNRSIPFACVPVDIEGNIGSRGRYFSIDPSHEFHDLKPSQVIFAYLNDDDFISLEGFELIDDELPRGTTSVYMMDPYDFSEAIKDIFKANFT